MAKKNSTKKTAVAQPVTVNPAVTPVLAAIAEKVTTAVLETPEAAPAAKAPKTTKTGMPALPKMPRVRKPKPAKECECGCGGQTKGGRFIPGHDARLHGWALRVERNVCTLEQVAELAGQGTADAVGRLMAAAAPKA